MPLSAKQQAFVSEYLIDKNGTQAAIRAGYSPRTAQEQSSVLLSKPIIRQAVDTAAAAMMDDTIATAKRTLQEMSRLAVIDVRGFYDEHGKLKPIHELTPEQGACLASIETLQRNVTAGDGETETVYKVKLWDKTRALDMLAKHHNLLTERLDVTIHGDDLSAKVQKARARAKANRQNP